MRTGEGVKCLISHACDMHWSGDIFLPHCVTFSLAVSASLGSKWGRVKQTE